MNLYFHENQKLLSNSFAWKSCVQIPKSSVKKAMGGHRPILLHSTVRIVRENGDTGADVSKIIFFDDFLMIFGGNELFFVLCKWFWRSKTCFGTISDSFWSILLLETSVIFYIVYTIYTLEGIYSVFQNFEVYIIVKSIYSGIYSVYIPPSSPPQANFFDISCSKTIFPLIFMFFLKEKLILRQWNNKKIRLRRAIIILVYILRCIHRKFSPAASYK